MTPDSQRRLLASAFICVHLWLSLWAPSPPARRPPVRPDETLPADLRQSHREDATPPWPALHRDGPAVRLRDPLGDRQPETGARTVPGTRARRVGSPEPLEDVGQVAGGDADAAIGDG